MNTDRPVRQIRLRSDPRQRRTRRRTLTPLQSRIRADLGIPIPFPRPIPASILRAAVDVYTDFAGAEPRFISYEREMCWAYMLITLGLPPMWSWNEVHAAGSPTQRIPLEILIQLDGRRIESGISVVYARRRMLLVDTFAPLGDLGDLITELPDPKALWLADPATIDLTL